MPQEAASRIGLEVTWDEREARHGLTLLVASLEDDCVRLYTRGIRELAEARGLSAADVAAEALAHEVLHAAAARAGAKPTEAVVRGLAARWARRYVASPHD